MRVTLAVDIAYPGQHVARASLDLEVPFAPVVGMEFSHAAWHVARPAKSVTWMVESEAFFVWLGTIEMRDREEAEQIAEAHNLHGWQRI